MSHVFATTSTGHFWAITSFIGPYWAITYIIIFNITITYNIHNYNLLSHFWAARDNWRIFQNTLTTITRGASEREDGRRGGLGRGRLFRKVINLLLRAGKQIGQGGNNLLRETTIGGSGGINIRTPMRRLKIN